MTISATRLAYRSVARVSNFILLYSECEQVETQRFLGLDHFLNAAP